MKNNLCYACLKDSEDVYPMPATDMYWYSRLIKEMAYDTDPLMCGHCTGLFRKLIVFVEQCLKAQIFLQQMYSKELELLPTPMGRSLAISPTKTYYLGPGHIQDLDFDMKAEDSISESNAYITEDEDDVPLILLCGDNDDENENVKKEAEENDSLDTGKPDTLEVKSEKASSLPSQSKKERRRKTKTQKKTLREGFTSRMVQETTEYIVIKLTKEQVLEEMRERSLSNKYLRAPYKCEDCVKGFNFEDVLQTHMDKHSPKNGALQCEICKQRCPTAVSLRGHMKSHTSRYKCKLCGYVRLSRQHVLEHYTISHSDSSAAYSCEGCPFTTNKRTVMQRHVRLMHGRTERHTCHKCGKLYKTLDSLRVHTMRHESKKRFQCDQCNLTFVYPTLLQKHVQSVHVRRDYYCVECDIKFKSMDTLKLHFKRAKKHRDTSSYKCESTPSTETTTPSIKAKAHACLFCARGYASRAALRAHVHRRHTSLAKAEGQRTSEADLT